MELKKVTLFMFALAVLSGCAGANTKGITATFMYDGTIWHKEVQAKDYNFEIHMFENKVGPTDIYGINTTTPEERIWVARDAFGFIPSLSKTKEYPTCKSPIEIVGEDSYQVTNHPKKWLNTTWWVLYVQCDDVNPHYIR